MEPFVRVVLLLAAFVLAGIGVLWTVFAIIGTEWDFCRGNECIAGELMGIALAVLGVAVGWSGIRVGRHD